MVIRLINKSKLENMSKQKSILEAAKKIFSEKGYHQTTMDEIAQTAQVAKGTLYYNYSSKSKLFAATVTEGMEEIMANISHELESELPFLDHFKLLLSSTIRLYLQHSEVTRIYVNELSSGIDSDTLSEIKNVRRKFIAFVTETMATGQAKGYLKPLNRELSAMALVGIVDALCNDQLDRDTHRMDEKTLDETIETVFSILATGLLNPEKIKGYEA